MKRHLQPNTHWHWQKCHLTSLRQICSPRTTHRRPKSGLFKYAYYFYAYCHKTIFVLFLLVSKKMCTENEINNFRTCLRTINLTIVHLKNCWRERMQSAESKIDNMWAKTSLCNWNSCMTEAFILILCCCVFCFFFVHCYGKHYFVVNFFLMELWNELYCYLR